MADIPLAPLPASRLARFGRKSFDLLRRHKRAALIYGASLLAAKALDKAHAALPDNTPLAIADTVASEVVGFEDMMFFGGLPYIAKASASAFKAQPETLTETLPEVPPAAPQRTEAATPDSPHAEVSPRPLRRPTENQGQREAAFMPVVMPHRRHHAKLAQDALPHEIAAPRLAAPLSLPRNQPVVGRDAAQADFTLNP